MRWLTLFLRWLTRPPAAAQRETPRERIAQDYLRMFGPPNADGG